MFPPALDRMLNRLSVDVDAFALCNIAADAEIAVPALDAIEVHQVLSGTLYLAVDGQQPLRLAPGAMVMVPAGLVQRMAGGDAPVRQFEPTRICSMRPDGFESFDAGSEPAVRVVCGTVRASVSGIGDPFRGLRRLMIAHADTDPLIGRCFAAIRAEVARPGIGTRALCGALMKACLVLVIRRHIVDGRMFDLPGLFRRPWLSKAVALVMEAPSAPHSVSSLAQAAGRSRSIFAKEFKEDLGIAPMEFVAQVRLARACSLLGETAMPVAAVASEVGFASRSHFSRAFRRAHDVDPSRWRRQATSAPL